MGALSLAKRLAFYTFNECIRGTKVSTKRAALQLQADKLGACPDFNELNLLMAETLDPGSTIGKSIDDRANPTFDKWIKGAGALTKTRQSLTNLQELIESLSKYQGKLSANYASSIDIVFNDCIKSTSSSNKSSELSKMRERLLSQSSDEAALKELEIGLTDIKSTFYKAIREKTGIGSFSKSKSRTELKMEELKVALQKLAVMGDQNLSAWMKDCNDNVTLGQLTMPGSHDAAVYNDPSDPANKPEYRKISALSWGVCHNLSIYNQARVGVRYFDIRIAEENSGKWRASHDSSGFGVWGASSDKILDDMVQFITENPTEVLFYKVTHTEEKEYILTMMRKLRPHLLENHQEKPLTELPLRKARGKIIVLMERSSAYKKWKLEECPDFIKKGHYPYTPNKGKDNSAPPNSQDGITVFGGNDGDSVQSMIKGQLKKATKHAQNKRNKIKGIFFQMSWTQMRPLGSVEAAAKGRFKQDGTPQYDSPHQLIGPLVDFLMGNEVKGTNAFNGFQSPGTDGFPNFLHMDFSSEDSSRQIIRLNDRHRKSQDGRMVEVDHEKVLGELVMVRE